MDHKEAQETGAVERYLLGELATEQRDAFEEHYFSCGECAEDVRDGAALIDDAKVLLAAEPARAALEVPKPWEHRSWRQWFWPVPAGALAAAAALLVVVVYQNGVVLPELRRDASVGESIQAVPSAFLAVSRAAQQVVSVGKADRQAMITLSRSSDASFAYHRCTLLRGDGHVVTSAVVAAPRPGDELQLMLPLARLVPGDYVMVVTGMASETTEATGAPATQYHFTLRHEEGGR